MGADHFVDDVGLGRAGSPYRCLEQLGDLVGQVHADLGLHSALPLMTPVRLAAMRGPSEQPRQRGGANDQVNVNEQGGPGPEASLRTTANADLWNAITNLLTITLYRFMFMIRS